MIFANIANINFEQVSNAFLMPVYFSNMIWFAYRGSLIILFFSCSCSIQMAIKP